MLACFSAMFVRAILLVVTSLFVTGTTTDSPQRQVIRPRIRVVPVNQADSTEADTLKARPPRRPTEPSKRRRRKPVSISITDEGLKVGSEDDAEVIFEFDSEELSRALSEIEAVEAYHESILADIEDDDPRRYYTVRGNDLVRFGRSIYVGEGEMVRGNVVAIFGDVEVEGKVMGDVVSIMGDIDLGADAIVNGEVVSVLGGLDQHEDARVRGETVRVGGGAMPYSVAVPYVGRGLVFGAVSKIIAFIVGILLLGIVMAFLSDRMRRSSTFVFGSFFKSLGIGALVLIVGSVVIALLAVIFSITIIGIPVAILIVLSFVALIILGYFVSAIALGKFVYVKTNFGGDSSFVHGLIGLVLLSILGLIASFMFFSPFVAPLRFLLKTMGGFIQLIALFTGIGAFIVSRAGARSTETKPQLPE